MLIILFLGVFVSSLSTLSFASNAIANKVYVNGINLKGYTMEEAATIVNEQFPREVVFKLLDEQGEELIQLPLALEAINAHIPMAELQQILNQKKITNTLSFFSPKKYYRCPMAYQNNLLEEWIEQEFAKLSQHPKDATFKIANGQPVVEKEQYGINLTKEDFHRFVENSINNNDLFNPSLTVTAVKPAVLASHLPDVSKQIGTCSTVIDNHSANKLININLAVELINGYLLEPGQVFSFVDLVGKATGERGFALAPVIVNNRFTEGYGGGICQVSSTIYQSALQAKLLILERKNHSLPTGYLPLGFDATVAYGHIDLKLQNPYNYPIMLTVWTDDNNLIASFYGPEYHKAEIVEIVPKNIQVIKPPIKYIDDDNLPIGTELIEQKGTNGYKVHVYRLSYYDDQLINKELITVDTYRATETIIRKGNSAIKFKK